MKGGEIMKNKFLKSVIVGLIVVAAVAAVMSSFVVWHQPETPECIA